MPMMPMDPAKAVSRVRPFLVPRFWKLREGGGEGHGDLLVLFRGALGLLVGVGIGVADDRPVPQAHDAGGVPLGQLLVVGDHHHQGVLGDLLEQVHDLHAGLAVQGAGGLVSQQDGGVVDEGPGDGHPLHLAPGHLVGALVELVPQAHLLQHLHRPLAALLLGHPGQGEGHLHIGQHRLVGDEVVALKDKADGVVAVVVPVGVLVVLGGPPVDDQVAAVVPVQAADDVQQGGFAGAALAQDGDELMFPEGNADPLQGGLAQLPGDVGFDNVF